ncbi:hypothetical protein [Psittacicella hinzii]|uniref:Uncharacterized protein n=1 Tax=Psittacicella hinzii TaxID=2028575 RepID=A0A3A1YR92_9GAMM|nr:hypothetical protein [Psittacicella hinzii]RIY39688.1 hypothetical protein CKF58_01705 [Psittacicella hinzii]
MALFTANLSRLTLKLALASSLALTASLTFAQSTDSTPEVQPTVPQVESPSLLPQQLLTPSDYQQRLEQLLQQDSKQSITQIVDYLGLLYRSYLTSGAANVSLMKFIYDSGNIINLFTQPQIAAGKYTNPQANLVYEFAQTCLYYTNSASKVSKFKMPEHLARNCGYLAPVALIYKELATYRTSLFTVQYVTLKQRQETNAPAPSQDYIRNFMHLYRIIKADLAEAQRDLDFTYKQGSVNQAQYNALDKYFNGLRLKLIHDYHTNQQPK